MSEIWVVPGAPLADGAGWRVWYSRAGVEDFSPAALSVSRADRAASFQQDWHLLAPLAGLRRRMGILTIRLDEPAPGEVYEITIPEVSKDQRFSWMAMPNSIDENGAGFLFGSCFWRDNDKVGSYSAAVRELCKRAQPKPAFKVMAGDQLYQDWPVDLTNHTPLEVCATRYDDYWGDPAYQEVLQACPNFFLCDDHEFWNDYPEFQIHLERTWTQESRDTYGAVTQNLYEYYQHCSAPSDKRWYSFDIGRVSIFVCDSRSQRDPVKKGSPHFFQEPQWTDLVAWIENLRGPGVLVIGQPLYQKDGGWRDHSLSNFVSDYARLCDLIAQSHKGLNAERKPHQILMLSGDIHCGRYAIGNFRDPDLHNELAELHELIASASSKIGPYPQRISIEAPPDKMPSSPPAKLNITMPKTGTMPTGDNNIGMVQMFVGTNGRVRFRLSIWRVRPHDSRSWWDMLRGEPQPQDQILELFAKEIQLQ